MANTRSLRSERLVHPAQEWKYSQTPFVSLHAILELASIVVSFAVFTVE